MDSHVINSHVAQSPVTQSPVNRLLRNRLWLNKTSRTRLSRNGLSRNKHIKFRVSFAKEPYKLRTHTIMQWTITYVQNFATDAVHRDAVTLAYPKETPLYTKETHIHYRNVQDSTTDAVHRYSAHIKCMRASFYTISAHSLVGWLRWVGSITLPSLLYGSFAKETQNFIDPTNQSHPIRYRMFIEWLSTHPSNKRQIITTANRSDRSRFHGSPHTYLARFHGRPRNSKRIFRWVNGVPVTPKICRETR